MFWLLLMVVMCALTFWGMWILSERICRFSFLRKKTTDNKRIKWFVFAGLVTLLIILTILLNPWNSGIIYLHLLFFWLIADLVAWLIRKLTIPRTADFKNIDKEKRKPYYAGIVALIYTVSYLCVGAYLDYHVFETDYAIASDKEIEGLKVALISDSHVGTTFDGEGFAKHLEAIQAVEPDILLLAGDFVDDDSTKEDMIRSCEALGEFQCKYGVYYCYGNHDKGYYGSRGYTGDDIKRELEANGVHVLEDECELIDDRFYVIGRRDPSDSARGFVRKGMDEIVASLDASKYMIVMDHQPTDYDAEEASNVDLVLSGHTHGGQLFPINGISELFKINDQVYGLTKRNSTNFLVTSGISDWAIKFKTGCKSEFVVIEIN